MKIRKATEKDIKEAVKIARDLKEWFTKTAIENMKTDFKVNNVVVAVDKKMVVGFLCYSSYSGKMQIIWMGIKRGHQDQGLGSLLLKWLENKAKKLGLKTIEVETLPDEVNYEPYKKTRNFYYKHGFKRIMYKKATIKGWDDQIVLEKKV